MSHAFSPSDDSSALSTAALPLRPKKHVRISLAGCISTILLVLSGIFFAMHFIHLSADFPNHSPWMDWSKYTDEGWYGDAAIRHYLSGHWYFEGDFNPAVALPVWPAIELLVFRFTGVSIVAARALTLCVFAITLLSFRASMQRHMHVSSDDTDRSIAAPLAIFFLCTSPMMYVFDRLAILEPLLIALTSLALLTASHMGPQRPGVHRFRHLFPGFLLAILLPCMVLTKTTAVCLFPSIFYMIWARAGYRFRSALWLGLPPLVGGLTLWCGYFFIFVRPRYLQDYRYLFSANAYTGIELEPAYKVVLNTIADGAWIGLSLYIAFFAVIAFAVFWRPKLLRNPLFPSLLLWIAGYFIFLAYHNNLQPRYYLVVAVPITVVVAMGIDALWREDGFRGAGRTISAAIAVVAAAAIALPDSTHLVHYVLHPTYEFETAAQGIKRIVLSDPSQSHLILSISGSDLTLMTGLPSIDDDFGTLDLDQRVKQYRPGWYAAWNDVEDDKADALTPLYTIKRVAAFPAFDDPDRNLLILYRLDPVAQSHAEAHRLHRRRIRKPLVTIMGQQPSADQLQH
jgi:hypothetical protein